MKLANKVALITGAGSGMGQVASLLFAKEGAKVAAIDIDENAARETLRMIEAEGGKGLAVRLMSRRAPMRKRWWRRRSKSSAD